ncbi:MAG: two-component regulator propeller domain-containing protein [Pseudomonadota bacterium]
MVRRLQSFAVIGFALALIGLAAASVLRPDPAYKVPEGWTWWPQTGPVQAILLNNEDLLVGGADGLFRLDPSGAVNRVRFDEAKLQPAVFSLLGLGGDRLVVGHQEGLSVFAEGQWTTYQQLGSTRVRMVRGLLRDGNGRIWVGGDGALVRMEADWKQAAPLLDGPTVRTIAEAPDQTIWVGSMDGLRRYDIDDAVSFWSSGDGLPDRSVNAIAIEPASGLVWAGLGFDRMGGAVAMAPKDGTYRLDRVIDGTELAGEKVRSLMADPDGRLWFGHEYDGLSIRHPGGDMTVLAPNADLPDREVTVVRRFRDGAIWLGTLSGLIRIAPEAVAILLADRQSAPGQ